MTRILPLEDPAAVSVEFAGGKGANLARLVAAGFPVPPGFVIGAPAYAAWIASAGDALAGLEALPADDPAALRDACDRIRAALAAVPLPAGLGEEIDRALAPFPADAPFAVRSSSNMEDLAGAAFAGQHETFLGCRGGKQVRERVRDCWLSLWADRAVAYRRQSGFDHRGAAMAVVVQRMVACESAGVAFSVDPVRGDLGTLVVDANFGLGESVVSGEGDVDHFEIDRKTRAVRSSRIARKTRRVVAEAGGVREVAVEGPEADAPSLDASRLGELADLVLRVEGHFRFPQDVEWGFAEGRLHLLQSRPVTSIPPRWTRDESAERFPEAITPLTWDFVDSGFHRSLEHSFRLMGLPPYRGKWFSLHDHHVYGNQNAVELYARGAPLDVRDLGAVRAALPVLRHRFRWAQELPGAWARDLDHYLVGIGELMAEPLDRRDLAGAWDHVLAVQEHGARYFLPNIAISLGQGMLHRGLQGLVAAVAPAGEAGPLFDGLLGSADLKTGAINRELVEMAGLVRVDGALERALEQGGARAFLADPGLDAFPAFGARFRRFLRDHGHREIEFDAYAPTWVEAPWVVLDNLRLILRSPALPDSAAQERARRLRAQEAERDLFRRAPEDLHFLYAEILRLARTYTALDDLEHYQTTRLTLPLRRGLREVGTRLTARGVLGEPMDVFFAGWKPLEAAVRADDAGRWRDLAAAVRAEKKAWAVHRAAAPPWVPGETAPPPVAGERVLEGIPGSPGQAEGPVFRVLGPEDFGRFPRGAVLVARTTNPTWTPLFYGAAAVVTASGGPLSHGAVTAREMGIPAVMAVRSALDLLPNGMRVRVDGTKGTVRLPG